MDTASQLPSLLRGDARFPGRRPGAGAWRVDAISGVIVVLGAGAFGAALGLWRSADQALYAAVKLPCVLLLVAAGNGLINGMLAPLLGMAITLRQSLSAVLASFAICAAILGGLGPLLAFMIWNSPPLGGQGSGFSHSLILLTNVASLTGAGIAGSLRLYQSLLALGGGRTVAMRVLCAWLGMNLFLGSQLSWLLRPFVGSPGLPVEFLRPDALDGNFFEAVFRSAGRLL